MDFFFWISCFEILAISILGFRSKINEAINLAKNIDEFANKYEDKVVIYKVNVDDSSDVAENAGVTGLPFFAFYKGGAQVGHIASSNTDTIEKKLISYL